jgi:predicted phosphodiesterase
LNPGSASLPRNGQAPSVAILDIRRADIGYRFVALPES